MNATDNEGKMMDLGFAKGVKFIKFNKERMLVIVGSEGEVVFRDSETKALLKILNESYRIPVNNIDEDCQTETPIEYGTGTKNQREKEVL